MPRTSKQSFIGRLRDQLHDLPPAERRLGDFILDFPGELASYTAAETARMAHVSNQTMTRFCRRLGYTSFEAARRHWREGQQDGAALFLAKSTATGGDASVESRLLQGHRNIDATFDRLANHVLADLADAIVAARQVWIVGYRISHAFASYLRWQIVQAVEPITVLPGPEETVGQYLAGIAATDCLVVFALRPTVPQVAEIIGRAAGVGAKIVCVTDQPDEVEVRGRWLIHCETSAPGPLYNHVSVMALCDMLAIKVLEVAGRARRKRTSAAARDALGELA